LQSGDLVVLHIDVAHEGGRDPQSLRLLEVNARRQNLLLQAFQVGIAVQFDPLALQARRQQLYHGHQQSPWY
jgi:hypothetical protein